MSVATLGVPLVQPGMVGRAGWVAGWHYVRHVLNSLALLRAEEVPDVVVFLPAGLEEPLLDPEAATRAPWLKEVRIPDEVIWERGMELQRYFDEEPCRVFFPIVELPNVVLRGAAVGWVPDFQDRHHPEFFSPAELASREVFHDFAVGYCTRVVCSSAQVRSDLATFYPELQDKGVVLRFGALVPESVLAEEPTKAVATQGIEPPFVYLPNQFWAHKNHEVVFEAWRLLQERGIAPLIVCSGETSDYRRPNHFAELQRLIERNGLQGVVRILGLVERRAQLQLYRAARLVLQPSLFEGWSTTIEEAKALGKPLVASGIRVHREQCRGTAEFFQPDRPEELADLVSRLWDDLPRGHVPGREARALSAARERSRRFGRGLVTLVKDVARAVSRSGRASVGLTKTLPALVSTQRRLSWAEEEIRGLRSMIEIREGEVEELRRTAESLRSRVSGLEPDRSEGSRNALRQIGELSALVARYEAYRVSSLADISAMSELVGRYDAERASLESSVRELSQLIGRYDREHQDRLSEVRDLSELVLRYEEERQSHLANVRELSALIGRYEDDRRSAVRAIGELSRLVGRYEAARLEGLETQRRLSEVVADYERHRVETLEQLERERSRSEARASEVDALTGRLAAIECSRSWRLTAPLRLLRRLILGTQQTPEPPTAGESR